MRHLYAFTSSTDTDASAPIENADRLVDFRRRHRERRQHAHHAFGGAIDQQTRLQRRLDHRRRIDRQLERRASRPRRARR